ncbi:MAG: hypothetical protein ACFHU9_07120 [Fluviicola sp.]
MSALKPVFFFLLFFIVVSSCSTDASKDKADTLEEQLPKVDTSKFRKYKGEGFSIQLLKEMTVNEASGMMVLDADFLPKEYHLSIEPIPITHFRNDSEFPKKPDEQLHWLMNQEVKRIVSGPKKSEVLPLEKTTVDGARCVKQTIYGYEYGFPLRKAILLRYYLAKDAIIKITAWTTVENAKEYEKLAQYMGMSFRMD